MENLIGVQLNDFSALVQLDCLERIWQWLPVACREPHNLESREQLSWAAHYVEASGGVPNGHAVAHAIGALYHIVHGHACAMTLPTAYRHFAQAPEAGEAIRSVADRIGVATSADVRDTAEHVALTVRDFTRRLGLPGLRATMQANGFNDSLDQFIDKAVPLVMDDFKSRLWTPPIHTGDPYDNLTPILTPSGMKIERFLLKIAEKHSGRMQHTYRSLM